MKLTGTKISTLNAIEARCVYGLEYFCDGTPNKSRCRAGGEYPKRKPCQFLNGGCPVRGGEKLLADEKLENFQRKKVLQSECVKKTSPNISRGDSIALFRRKKRLTQEELAETVGVGVWTIRNWERGSAIPRAKNLQKLEKVLGVKL